MKIYGNYMPDEKCTNCIHLRWPTDGPVHGFNTCLLDGKNYLQIRRCDKFKELTLDSTFTVTMGKESTQASIMTYINYLENRACWLNAQLNHKTDTIAGLRLDLTETQEELFKHEEEKELEIELTGTVSRTNEKVRELQEEIKTLYGVLDKVVSGMESALEATDAVSKHGLETRNRTDELTTICKNLQGTLIIFVSGMFAAFVTHVIYHIVNK